MAANALLDGRIDWTGTLAALKAAFPNYAYPNGCQANTTDYGLVVYNATTKTWGPSYQASSNFGFLSTQLGRWRPTGNRAQTLTAAISGSATSGTLTGNWTPPSGFYPIYTSASGLSAPACYGYFTQGSTAVAFYAFPYPTSGYSPGTAFAPPAATANITVGGTPPIAASSNAVLTSSAINTGTPVAPTVAALDVPRALVAAWTGTAVMTITGTDQNGNVQTEASASGTSFTGKKAFATVTSIAVSANVTAATVGTGKVFGLPYRVSSGDIFDTRFNDAADAGTFVVPDLTNPATSSTGDVRGTYAPSGTPDGTKFVSAILKPADPASQFGTQGIQPA